MKAKNILKSILILVVIEAVLVAAICISGLLVFGNEKESPNVMLNVEDLVLDKKATSINVYVEDASSPDNVNTELDGYYKLIYNLPVTGENKPGKAGIIEFAVDEKNSEAIRAFGYGKNLKMTFSDNDGFVSMKSDNITLESVPYLRSVKCVNISSTGINVEYTYDLKSICLAVMAITFVLYLPSAVRRIRGVKKESMLSM